MAHRARNERPGKAASIDWFALALHLAVALIIIVAAIVFAAVLWSMR